MGAGRGSPVGDPAGRRSCRHCQPGCPANTRAGGVLAPRHRRRGAQHLARAVSGLGRHQGCRRVHGDLGLETGLVLGLAHRAQGRGAGAGEDLPGRHLGVAVPARIDGHRVPRALACGHRGRVVGDTRPGCAEGPVGTPRQARVEVGLPGAVELGKLRQVTPADQGIPVGEGLVAADDGRVQRGVMAEVAGDGSGVAGGIEGQCQRTGSVVGAGGGAGGAVVTKSVITFASGWRAWCWG